MKIDKEPALSFDDVVLVPQNTDIRSRKFPNTSTIISPKLKLRIPIISSCMTTITEDEMAIKMWEYGGLGIIHRYNTIEEQVSLAKKVMKKKAVAGFAIPSNKDFYERASALYDTGVKVFCVDIAHGDSIMMFDALKKLRKEFGQRITIIAGNAATGEGTKRIVDAGADAVRLGVSGGSVCETRGISGCGFPTLQSVMNAREYMDKFGYYNYCLIADGGIKSSGDITKSLGGGAHAVILGQLLAATDEAPGSVITKDGKKYKLYAGMASFSAQSKWRPDKTKDIVPEGAETLLPYKGAVADVLHKLIGGLQSGMTYQDAMSIDELYKNAYFSVVNTAGLIEGKPHAKKD